MRKSYIIARRTLAQRVKIAKRSARCHGVVAKFRKEYLRMVSDGFGFNARFGVGRCPKNEAYCLT